MAYAYDDQNIFAKILRGELPANGIAPALAAATRRLSGFILAARARDSRARRSSE